MPIHQYIKQTEILLMLCSNLRAGQFHAARRPCLLVSSFSLKGSKGRYRQLSLPAGRLATRVTSQNRRKIDHMDGQGRGDSIRFIHGIHT